MTITTYSTWRWLLRTLLAVGLVVLVALALAVILIAIPITRRFLIVILADWLLGGRLESLAVDLDIQQNLRWIFVLVVVLPVGFGLARMAIARNFNSAARGLAVAVGTLLIVGLEVWWHTRHFNFDSQGRPVLYLSFRRDGACKSYSPGLDRITGRPKYEATVDRVAWLSELASQPVRVVDPAVETNWFDANSGEPNLWYVETNTNQWQFFNRPHFHQQLRVEVMPITPEVMAQWQAEQNRQATAADALRQQRAAEAKAEAEKKERQEQNLAEQRRQADLAIRAEAEARARLEGERQQRENEAKAAAEEKERQQREAEAKAAAEEKERQEANLAEQRRQADLAIRAEAEARARLEDERREREEKLANDKEKSRAAITAAQEAARIAPPPPVASKPPQMESPRLAVPPVEKKPPGWAEERIVAPVGGVVKAPFQIVGSIFGGIVGLGSERRVRIVVVPTRVPPPGGIVIHNQVLSPAYPAPPGFVVLRSPYQYAAPSVPVVPASMPSATSQPYHYPTPSVPVVPTSMPFATSQPYHY